MVRLDKMMPRLWIGFGQSIVRGRCVSGHWYVLIAVAFCLCPHLPYPPVPSSLHVLPHRDIGVHVFSRDVFTPALTCIDI